MKTTAVRTIQVVATLGTILVSSTLVLARDADLLDFVSPDAITVGAVRMSEIKSSPFGTRIFSEADHAAIKGEGAEFLKEAGLNLSTDIDTVVFAASPAKDQKGEMRILLGVQGRFDAAKLAAAVALHGARLQKGAKGDYYRLPDKENAPHAAGGSSCGAVAFLGPSRILIGSEDAVADALARGAGGGSGVRSGVGIGRELRRIRPESSAWILIDMTRQNQFLPSSPSSGGAAMGVLSAMKSVAVVALQADLGTSFVNFSATGLATDEETGKLLEDTLRGLLALWRMAVQEKQPDLVAVIRKIQVTRDGTSVSIGGSLPIEFLTQLTGPGAKNGTPQLPAK